MTIITVSIGLLGLAALQMNGVKSSQEAFLHSQASFLAYDIVERMRVNPEALDDYAIDFDDSYSSVSCHAAACTKTEMAAADIYEWREFVSDLLPPQGKGAVSIAGTTVSVSVQWTIYGDVQQFNLEAEL